MYQDSITKYLTTTLSWSIEAKEENKAKIKEFTKSLSQRLIDQGIRPDTVFLVEAIDADTPYFNKEAITFSEDYPVEVKERIIAIINEEYQKYIETWLGSFMRMISKAVQPTQSEINEHTLTNSSTLYTPSTSFPTQGSDVTILPDEKKTNKEESKDK